MDCRLRMPLNNDGKPKVKEKLDEYMDVIVLTKENGKF